MLHFLRLNARCNVLTAANPAFGFYDPKKSEHPASGFPAVKVSKHSIFHLSVVSSDISLSRFDLVFIMRDVKDKDSDGKFAHHVLKMHQHRDPKEQEDINHDHVT